MTRDPRPADRVRLERKGWRVVPRGDGRLFDLYGPTMGGPLTHIGEDCAWRSALGLEHWEGMELREPKQLDLFGVAA